MKFTQKLLGYLHKVFDKDPHKFLALRLQYQGGLTWQVSDGFLYTTVTGGPGQNLTIDLSQYTVAQLVSFLYTQPGYSVLYADTSILSTLKALVLMDGSNDISLSNGDHLYGYTNVLWSYMDAQSNELEQAQTQIGNMLQQMSTTTASSEWLDLLGAYYGVPRLQGELDASYGPRIIAEVLRPRGNNVAIEMAIATFTGQAATVSDVTLYGPTLPLYNGAIARDSSHQYNAANVPIYGLFDVQYGYDLINGGDVAAFTQTVKDLVNRLRDAGTQMRSLSLTGSALTDALTPPSDLPIAFGAGAAFTDTLTAPTDPTFVGASVISPFSDTLTAPTDSNVSVERYASLYNALRTRSSAISYAGGTCVITPAPAIDWDFRSGALDPSLTFSRASIGTYFDALGVMQTAAAGAPRFDHDPLTTKGVGLLMEESRTNRLTYSQAFDNAAWTIQSSLSIVTAAVVAPDGTTTGEKLADATTSSVSHAAYQISTGSNAQSTNTWSVYAHASDRQYLSLRLISVSTVGNYCYGGFDLNAGTATAGNIGTATGAVASITAIGGGWYRCSVSGIADPAGTGGLQANIHAPLSLNGSAIYAGTVGQGIYIWGAQLEAGAFPTSYIPTTTAAVTRSADLLTTTSLPWFNANAGTFAVEAAVISALASGTSFVAFEDGSTNGLMLYKGSGAGGLSAFAGTGSSSTLGTITSGAFFRAAHSYSGAGVSANAAALGNAAVAVSGSAVTATQLSIGSARSSFLLNGWIKRLTYVASQLDPALLPILST